MSQRHAGGCAVFLLTTRLNPRVKGFGRFGEKYLCDGTKMGKAIADASAGWRIFAPIVRVVTYDKGCYHQLSLSNIAGDVIAYSLDRAEQACAHLDSPSYLVVCSCLWSRREICTVPVAAVEPCSNRSGAGIDTSDVARRCENACANRGMATVLDSVLFFKCEALDNGLTRRPPH